MMNLKYYLRGLGIGIVVTALIMGIAVGGKKQVLSDDEIRQRAKELGMVEESTVLADTVAGQSASAASGPETDADGQVKSNHTPAPAEKTSQPEEEKTPAAGGEESPAPTAEKTATPTPEKTPEPTAEKMASPSASAEETPENVSATSAPVPSAAVSPTPTQEKGGDLSPEQTPEVPAEEPQKTSAPVSQAGSIQINSGDGSYTVSVRLEQAGLVSSASEFDRYLYQNGYDKKIRTGVFEIPAGAGMEEIAKIITRAE